MEYCIALDGGGTKLQGILFDSDYRLIAACRSGGVNQNVHSDEAVRRHIDECIGGLFAQAEEKKCAIGRISRVISSWGAVYEDVIAHYRPVDRFITCGEGTAGILCCGLTTGLLALSGTGSDIFLIRDCIRVDAIGGWGYLLGDEGSGTWIGRQGIRSMLRVLEKTDPEDSRMHGLLREKYHPNAPDELVGCVLHARAPGHELGSVCKIVNAAAQEGDFRATEILVQAGQILANDVLRMKRKHMLPDRYAIGTTGSVFQFCVPVRDAFTRRLAQSWPKAEIHHAIFQPIVGCIIYDMLQNGHTLDEQTIQYLKQEYAAFCT